MANAKGSVKKVVLAYSGGLDTSIIIPWLKEHYGGAEVIAFCGDVGQGDDFEAVKAKALETGASKCIVKDLREEFVRDYCYKALSAGAVYEDRYLLGTALARPLLAYHQVQVAIKERADALAHGATGKGNDQVRFEVTYGAFAPHMKVIAPWREWTIRSREDALGYARRHGVPVEQTKRDLFSRDGNLWHLSHEGGNLEDVWDAPQKGMFKLTVDPLDAPARPQLIVLGFERGVPVSARRPAPEAREDDRGAEPRSPAPTAWAASTSSRTASSASSRAGSTRRRRGPSSTSRTASSSGWSSTATLCTSSSRCRSATRSSSTTACGSRRCARLSPPSSTRPSRRSRARCGSASTRAPPRPSAAARPEASTARTSRRSARAWHTTTRTRRGSSASSDCPSASAR